MAAEIRVLSAGRSSRVEGRRAAFQKAVRPQREYGFQHRPEIRKRYRRGEAFGRGGRLRPPRSMNSPERARSRRAPPTSAGGNGGFAVRPGAPVPDISSGDALKRSVLAAESIVFNRASSGILLGKSAQEKEIYDQVQGQDQRATPWRA